MIKRTCLGVLCGVLLISSGAFARDIYVYESKDGSRLITDHRRMERGYRLIKVYRAGDPWYQSMDTPAPSSVSLDPVPSPYDDMIARTAASLRIDPSLIKAVMHVESAFDRNAISPKGARGLMQLMPGTARRYGVASAFDPRQNIIGGARYLRDLLYRFHQDHRLALAGYNAGENAVERYNGIPPYPETQHYVRKVIDLYKKYRLTGCDGAPSGSVVLSCTRDGHSGPPDNPLLSVR